MKFIVEIELVKHCPDMCAHRDCLRKKLKEVSKEIVFYNPAEENKCLCEKCKKIFGNEFIINENIFEKIEERNSLLYKMLLRGSKIKN